MVRHAHVDFVEHLARRIHELDPVHPVFAAHEHSRDLAGALADFDRGAPSLDFTAVNSYYERQISTLHAVAARFDPSRPYLISEFGPDGYWESEDAKTTASGAIVEPATREKIASYERGWAQHTAPYRGQNLGGVAYCWRDRLESTATWFGLNDEEGRPKPTFLALQKLWTGRASATAPQIRGVRGLVTAAGPGEQLDLQVVAQGARQGPLECEWRVASELFDFTVAGVHPEGAKARIVLPSRPGNYRVYVHVSDGVASDEVNFPVEVTDESTATARAARPIAPGLRVSLLAIP